MTLLTTLTGPQSKPQDRLIPGMKGLVKSKGHRFATCWKVVRADGFVLRFTDHDKKLVVEDHPLNIDFSLNGTYVPAGGFENSATEKKANLQERNFDTRGILTSGAITHEDLAAGLYRKAELVEFLVDWRFPFAGSVYLRRYFIRETTTNGERWDAKVVGLSTKLRETVGEIYSRNCQHELGVIAKNKCNLDLTGNNLLGRPWTVTATVTGVSDPKFSFTAASLSGAREDGWFDEGQLTWLTGSNSNGAIPPSPVLSYQSAGGIFELNLRTPFNIKVGDQFSVHGGCNRTFDHCKNKFNNVVNYGGHQFIPGTDRAFETPNAK